MHFLGSSKYYCIAVKNCSFLPFFWKEKSVGKFRQIVAKFAHWNHWIKVVNFKSHVGLDKPIKTTVSKK